MRPIASPVRAAPLAWNKDEWPASADPMAFIGRMLGDGKSQFKMPLAGREAPLYKVFSKGGTRAVRKKKPAKRALKTALARVTTSGTDGGLGVRLKHLRVARRLSLRQLGEMTGTSASFISQLERGLTGASTASLNMIASALGVSVAMLFEERVSDSADVLRRSERPSMPPAHGCRKMLLSRRPLTHMEVYVGEFDIGGSTGPGLYTHGNAHEMLVVLRGVVEVVLGDAHHVLEEGDCIEYFTSTPHRIENIGHGRAEVMWIIAPPTSAGAELSRYTTWKPLAAR
jgi:transcriptional regulator with XRE-family HTH domain